MGQQERNTQIRKRYFGLKHYVVGAIIFVAAWMLIGISIEYYSLSALYHAGIVLLGLLILIAIKRWHFIYKDKRPIADFHFFQIHLKGEGSFETNVHNMIAMRAAIWRKFRLAVQRDHPMVEKNFDTKLQAQKWAKEYVAGLGADPLYQPRVSLIYLTTDWSNDALCAENNHNLYYTRIEVYFPNGEVHVSKKDEQHDFRWHSMEHENHFEYVVSTLSRKK